MSDLTIFDSHVHIWSGDHEAYPQTTSSGKPMPYEGSVEWLLELMHKTGISGALLVQAPWYGEDNRYFVDSMRRYEGKFVALGYLPDPLAPDAPDKLSKQYHEDGFRGIRIHLLDPVILQGVADGLADPLIERANSLGVPVQFLNRRPERHDVILGLAKRFPGVTFINDHLGHPHISEGYPYPSSATFFECGKMPNIRAKVSMHNNNSHEGYPWRDLFEFQKLTLEAYGPEKLMWGSNYPMQMNEATYAERLNVVRCELPFLSGDDLAWILGRTAREMWGLKDNQSDASKKS